jgi:chloramphenicol 3-O phosphotransferase
VKPVAIVLNGTSSSGKTSLARALQRRSSVPVLHASLDAFTDMFDWTQLGDEAARRECHRVGVANFHAALPILAAGPHPVVVDHVFEQRAWLEACTAALANASVFFIGVHCPVEVLEARERARGDRRVGMARWQLGRVHEHLRYDLELDTAELTADACAEAVLQRVGIPAKPPAS